MSQPITTAEDNLDFQISPSSWSKGKDVADGVECLSSFHANNKYNGRWTLFLLCAQGVNFLAQAGNPPRRSAVMQSTF
jgi:hypothetical protein